MGTQVFDVPIILQDLRPQEAYLQMFDALEKLDKVVDDIFSSISSRVSKEKGRLELISSRLGNAQNKIKQIETNLANRATKIHSPAKYPAPAHLESYVPLYIDQPVKVVTHSKFHLETVAHLPPASRDTLDQELNETRRIEKSSENVQALEGLGRLPHNLPSISSLLLFNTQDNPYKKYISLDNLAVTDTDQQKELEKKKALTDAPSTILLGDNMPTPGVIEYDYKPVLGSIPEFNLPNVLPNLPMVAADITWSVGVNVPEFTSIAPSGQNASIPVNIPSFDTGVPPIPTAVPPVPDDMKSTGPSPPSATGLPPPPTNVPQPPINGPPLPPNTLTTNGPPVTTGRDDGTDAGVGVGGSEEGEPAAEQVTPRGNLLDEIRRGKTLKKAEDVPAKKPPPATGDIFSDLIMALNRRRQNMGGKDDPSKKEKKKQEGVGDDIQLPDKDRAVKEKKEKEEEDWDE